MPPLQRFVRPLSRSTVLRALAGETLPIEPLPSRIDAEPLGAAVASIDDSLSGSAIDIALIEPLHRSTTGLSRAEAADMRMWHWIATRAFPDVVWRRWAGQAPTTPEDLPRALTDAMVGRFAGGSSLGGVSRNTFARLWWLAEHLNSDYESARYVLSRQDMFQAIFERMFGLHPPAVSACLSRFRDRSEGEVRAATKWLNYAARTTVLEVLTEQDIAAILDEALA